MAERRILFAWSVLFLVAATTVAESVTALVEKPRSVLGNTEASVARVLGEPLYRTVQKEENWHEPSALDDVVVLYYRSLTVFLRVARPIEKSMLTGVVVTDPQQAEHLGVLSSALEAAVTEKRVAQPTQDREVIVLSGRDSGLGEDTLTVILKYGRMAALVWSFVID